MKRVTERTRSSGSTTRIVSRFGAARHGVRDVMDAYFRGAYEDCAMVHNSISGVKHQVEQNVLDHASIGEYRREQWIERIMKSGLIADNAMKRLVHVLNF